MLNIISIWFGRKHTQNCFDANNCHKWIHHFVASLFNLSDILNIVMLVIFDCLPKIDMKCETIPISNTRVCNIEIIFANSKFKYFKSSTFKSRKSQSEIKFNLIKLNVHSSANIDIAQKMLEFIRILLELHFKKKASIYKFIWKISTFLSYL